VIPKILGLSAAILAVAFILVLPSAFSGEPASEVMPIRFGPAPVQRLADATRVETSTPRTADRRSREPGSARSLVDALSVSVVDSGAGAPAQSTGPEQVPSPVRDSDAGGVEDAQGTGGGRGGGGGGGDGDVAGGGDDDDVENQVPSDEDELDDEDEDD
jgi:hypothetical protein